MRYLSRKGVCNTLLFKLFKDTSINFLFLQDKHLFFSSQKRKIPPSFFSLEKSRLRFNICFLKKLFLDRKWLSPILAASPAKVYLLAIEIQCCQLIEAQYCQFCFKKAPFRARKKLIFLALNVHRVGNTENRSL